MKFSIKLNLAKKKLILLNCLPEINLISWVKINEFRNLTLSSTAYSEIFADSSFESEIRFHTPKSISLIKVAGMY